MFDSNYSSQVFANQNAAFGNMGNLARSFSPPNPYAMQNMNPNVNRGYTPQDFSGIHAGFQGASNIGATGASAALVGAPSMLGTIGGLAGGAMGMGVGGGFAGAMLGGIGGGLLGGMAAMPLAAAGGVAMQGVHQRMSMFNTIGQNYGGFTNASARSGQGFGMQGMQVISDTARQLAGVEDLMTSMGELNSVLKKLERTGMMHGITQAEDFASKFKKSVETLKTMSKVLGTTMEGALELFGEARQTGFYTSADILSNAVQRRSVAGITGMSQRTIGAVQRQGAMMANQLGGEMRYGSQAALDEMGMISTSLRSGRISQAELSELTGGLQGEEAIGAWAKKRLQIGARLSYKPMAKLFMLGFGERDDKGAYTGEYDEGAIEEFFAKGGGYGDLMKRARGINRQGMMSFVNKQGMLRAGLMSHVNDLMGVEINRISDRFGGEEAAGIIAQRWTGGNYLEAQELLRSAKNRGVTKAERNDNNLFTMESAARNAFMKEEGSIGGRIDRIVKEIDVSILERLRKVGDKVVDGMTELAQNVEDSLLGRNRLTSSAVGKIGLRSTTSYGGSFLDSGVRGEQSRYLMSKSSFDFDGIQAMAGSDEIENLRSMLSIFSSDTVGSSKELNIMGGFKSGGNMFSGFGSPRSQGLYDDDSLQKMYRNTFDSKGYISNMSGFSGLVDKVRSMRESSFDVKGGDAGRNDFLRMVKEEGKGVIGGLVNSGKFQSKNMASIALASQVAKEIERSGGGTKGLESFIGMMGSDISNLDPSELNEKIDELKGELGGTGSTISGEYGDEAAKAAFSLMRGGYSWNNIDRGKYKEFASSAFTNEQLRKKHPAFKSIPDEALDDLREDYRLGISDPKEYGDVNKRKKRMGMLGSLTEALTAASEAGLGTEYQRRLSTMKMKSGAILDIDDKSIRNTVEDLQESLREVTSSSGEQGVSVSDAERGEIVGSYRSLIGKSIDSPATMAKLSKVIPGLGGGVSHYNLSLERLKKLRDRSESGEQIMGDVEKFIDSMGGNREEVMQAVTGGGDLKEYAKTIAAEKAALGKVAETQTETMANMTKYTEQLEKFMSSSKDAVDYNLKFVNAVSEKLDLTGVIDPSEGGS